MAHRFESKIILSTSISSQERWRDTIRNMQARLENNQSIYVQTLECTVSNAQRSATDLAERLQRYA